MKTAAFADTTYRDMSRRICRVCSWQNRPKVVVSVGVGQKGGQIGQRGLYNCCNSYRGKGENGNGSGLSSDDSVGLRHGDGVADAAEDVVAAVAAAGGDTVVFTAGDWVVEDDFGGDEVAFGALRQGVEGLVEVGGRGGKLV